MIQFTVMDPNGINVGPVTAANSDEAVAEVKRQGYDVMDDVVVIAPGA